MVNIYDSDLFRINYLHVCHVYCKQVLQRIHVMYGMYLLLAYLWVTYGVRTQQHPSQNGTTMNNL